MTADSDPLAPTVFIVDDDAAFRHSLAALLENAGLRVEAHADGESFLAGDAVERPGCVLLDLSMPGLDGLEVQRRLAERGSPLPVVFLSATQKVLEAVRAVREGAFDFLVKPAGARRLLQVIRRALAEDLQGRLARQRAADRDRRQRHLSPREREVMALMVAGASCKEIGRQLGLSPRTVEVHRGNVLRKLGVTNLVELIGLVANSAP